MRRLPSSFSFICIWHPCAKARAAVVAVFSHARCDWANESLGIGFRNDNNGDGAAAGVNAVGVDMAGGNGGGNVAGGNTAGGNGGGSGGGGINTAAGFCGVVGCSVHDARHGRRGTLASALAGPYTVSLLLSSTLSVFEALRWVKWAPCNV